MARAVRSGTHSGSRADTAMLALCALLSLLATVLPLGVREAIAAGVRRSVVAPLVALQEKAELSRTAFLSHGSTTANADSLALRAMAVPTLAAENERLRKLLGLGAKLEWGFVPAEALHSVRRGEEYSLTLTAGSNAGIRPFSPVVAPEGLVGMVETVDPSMSLVISWAHPDFRVSAMAADGSAFGIVQAHLGAEPEKFSAERYLLELRGVPFRSALKPGTLIASSGLGGVYPRGIPIGTVLGELKTSEGWARTYLVRPAVLPPDVSTVMVLQPRRVAAGVQTVWSSVVAADSAARRVAAAGDSLRRDSLTAVAGDSAARASTTAAAPPPAAPAPRRAGDSTVRAGAGSLLRERRDTVARGARAAPRQDSSRRAAPRRDTIRPDIFRLDATPPDSTRRPRR